MTTAAIVPAGPPGRDWWVLTGMAVAASSATLASFTGLRGLAVLAGWPEHLAWLLPVTLDAYAMTAARVWLAATTRTRAAQRFARANALGAIGASIAGIAAYHAATTGLLHLTWPIVVTVGAVPAAILGLTAHLHALQGRTENRSDTASPRPDLYALQTDPGRGDTGSGVRDQGPTQAAPSAGPEPDRHPSTSQGSDRRRPTPRRRPRYRTEDDLLAAARDADARYRKAHAGRPITRDALRDALHISGSRASELRRVLHSSPASHPDSTPTEVNA